MRKVTFSVDEKLIEAARERARGDNSTLGDEFRRWLEQYVRGGERTALAVQVIDEMRPRVRSGGRRFTRDEMNEG